MKRSFNQTILAIILFLSLKHSLHNRTMCGNDISTIVVPTDGFLEQLRAQVATGKVSVKNNPQGTKQSITLREVTMMNRFDTTKLKQLELIRCEITHDLLEQLLKCDFTNLQVLSLNHNRVGPIGCRIIASSETLNNLKSLELAGNKIKDAGVKALATQQLADLEDLNLSDNGLTGEGVRALKTFSAVEYLSLSGNSLGDDCVDPIKTINPNGFAYLAVSRNNFSNEALRKFMPVKNLSVLLIDRNKITTAKSEVNAPPSLFVFY